jgi:hypothetical protein
MRPPLSASLPMHEERATVVNRAPRHADEPFIITILINKDVSPMCRDARDMKLVRFMVTGKAKDRFKVHRIDPLDYVPPRATRRSNGARMIRLIQDAIEEHTGVECIRLYKNLVSDIFDNKDEE